VRVQVKEVEGVVSGQLPSWLSGSLLVNGGGDYSRMQHMFDGYACVTKVKVEGGKAWGSQRYLSTEAYATYKQQGGCLGGNGTVSGPCSRVWVCGCWLCYIGALVEV
jgi:carotenoid cleavage dioxygenase-like enzyme